jgi:SNF2 family DNA or RNA helicase
MEYTHKIDQILNSYVESNLIFPANRLNELGKISLSFMKGSPETYFIVSGITSENNTSYESKVNFKKISDTEERFTSQCTCNLWTQDKPCHHIAGLLIKFKKSLENNSQGLHQSLPLSFISKDGVHVERYGTIVKSAPALTGARMNSSFSSLQYSLTSRKIINFPATSPWKGKLIVRLVPATTLNEYKEMLYIEEKYTYQFSWEIAGEEIKEISLFDVLYLFNWKTGEALELISEWRELILKLKLLDMVLDIQEFIRIFTSIKNKDLFQLYIDDLRWEDIPVDDAKWRFSINPSSRKSYLNLELELFSSEDKLIPLPSPFLIFITEQGWGGSFRSKNDALQFFKTLIEDFDRETSFHKKYLHSSSRKQIISEWITLLFTENEIAIYDYVFKKNYFLKTKIFKKVFLSFLESFQDIGLKTSFYLKEERKVIFQIPKSNVLEGVPKFYQTLNLFNISLFYDQVQVKTWKSSIRFERNDKKLDWFQLDLVISDEDLEIIKNAEITDNFIISKKGLILLADNQKDILRFMKKYTKLEVEESGDRSKGLTKFNLYLQRSRIFELFELKRLGIEGALTSEEEKFCLDLMNMENMPQYDIPQRYQELARPYQINGYNWLRFLFEHQFGACLADDMGLGKTLQTIMLLEALKNKVKKILIICPVSILYNWRNELTKFSDLTYSIYYGDEREFKTDAQVILTSYGLMKRESLSTLNDEEFDILIFDEVQHLKNIRSLGANAARQLKAKFRICLTGTPVENDLSEFYNIMDLCVPGVWGDLSLIKSASKQKNRLLARKTVKPFILRRTKDQVLKELPEKIENHVFLEFSQQEKDFYKNKLQSIQSNLLNNTGKRYGEILKSLLEIRQLCLWQKQPEFHSVKIDFLMENLEQLVTEGHKTLVFSQFTTYLDMIENKIRVAGWKMARIDGSQTIKKRTEQVEYFQNGDAQIFLISLKAGGFGLNLTAASYIFLMDPWWNPAVERQAIDRAHRIGQENKLTVYRPIIKDSVEEKVLLLQQSKRELFRDLMAEDDDEYFSGKLTMDDFKHLLT